MGAAQFRAAGLNLDLQLGQKSNCSEFRTLEMLIVSLLLCLLIRHVGRWKECFSRVVAL